MCAFVQGLYGTISSTTNYMYLSLSLSLSLYMYTLYIYIYIYLSIFRLVSRGEETIYIYMYTYIYIYTYRENERVRERTQSKKQQWRKCQITNPLSDQTLWDTSHTTPIQSQNILNESTYFITRNIKITTTCARFVLILLRFHAVSLRLLLNYRHSNDSEPKVHLFLLESKPHFCPASCSWWLSTSSTHHIPASVSCAQSEKVKF